MAANAILSTQKKNDPEAKAHQHTTDVKYHPTQTPKE